MSDHETESFTPYEPQTAYEWDYGEEPPRSPGGPPNILWGRLVVLGVLAILVFLIGRISAPNGVDEERLQELRADLAASQEQVEQLEAAIQQQPTVAATPTPSVTVGEQDDTAEDATFDGKTYTVVSGDTMNEIARRFCGDPAEAEVIADFNGISDPTLISPGMALKIPEDCGE